MKNGITVVTSIVGTRDTLREAQVRGSCAFLAYVDRKWNSTVWREERAPNIFKSARRNSRMPKILPHEMIDSEYSLWIDANISCLVAPEHIISDWLGEYDLVVFSHESRRCTFAEGEECSRRSLDSPLLIQRQMEKYSAMGFPKNIGLARCSVIARRHNSAIERFNNFWWAEFSTFSVRDQLSFMFAAVSCNVKLKMINEPIFTHPYFSIQSRPAAPETFD